MVLSRVMSSSTCQPFQNFSFLIKHVLQVYNPSIHQPSPYTFKTTTYLKYCHLSSPVKVIYLDFTIEPQKNSLFAL